jgi:hypothetical protein
MLDVTQPMCAEHADRPSLGVCVRCGTYLCRDCGYASGGQVVCLRCHGRTSGPKLKQLRIIAILYFVNAGLAAIGSTLFLLMGFYMLPDEGIATIDSAPAMTLTIYAALALGYLLGGAIQIAGGVSMLKRRRRWLAMTAIVVTCVSSPLAGLPGLLGLGLSIWALIVMVDRGVAAEFDRPRSER